MARGMTANWPFDPLTPFCADVITVDPPSDFENYSAAGETKGPRAQYATMSDDEIAALPIGDLASGDAWLFLWATAPKLPTNLHWLEKWGFKFVTMIVWHKVTASGKNAVGCGYVARSMQEPVLIGKVGSPPIRKPLDGVLRGVRREHSRKPEEFYAAIDRFADPHARKVDLFARQSRPGWTTWGNEAAKFDAPL